MLPKIWRSTLKIYLLGSASSREPFFRNPKGDGVDNLYPLSYIMDIFPLFFHPYS